MGTLVNPNYIGVLMMKIQHLGAAVSLLIGSIGAIATPANAFDFTSGMYLGDCGDIALEKLDNNDDISVSTTSSCTTADGITLSTDEGVLSLKEVNGTKGVGIYDDLHPNGSLQEIDYGENLMLSTAGPSIWKSIDISFLYQKGAFGDVVDEVASITAGGITGTLSVLGANSAQWSWGDITQNLTGDSTSSGGGFYSIANPFGDTAVSSVELTSSQDGNYIYSDFAVSGAEATTVPEPSVLLGIVALGGIGALRRR